jgi:hypothetical protein
LAKFDQRQPRPAQLTLSRWDIMVSEAA